MKRALLAFAWLALAPHAKAANVVDISCEPAFMRNHATIQGKIQIDKNVDGTLHGQAVFNAVIQKQCTTCTTQTLKSVQVEGDIEEVQGLLDANDNSPVYSVLFGRPLTDSGDVSYVKLAAGDQTGMTPNSYIRDVDGVYYFARCLKAKY